jgi:two-component system CheB/CheR fusion protein
MPDFLSETATQLQTKVPEVLRRWEAQVLAEVPAASTVDAKVLRDHLHVLLAQVVVALSPHAHEGATHRLTTSEQHGGERALLETYSLGEVLQEYSILRRTVLEVLGEGRPMSLEERSIINDALEQGLIGASTQYALIQRRAADEQVEEAQAETACLQVADQNKTEFLAWLGHEIRTPLSAINYALAILGSLELGSERAVRQVAVASRQSRHLSRLADDLLDLSRISQGTLEVRAEQVDLRNPLLDATEASKPLLEERGHRFECSLPEAPFWIDGDSVRLVQAFTNLLNNAARYSPEGSEVRLSLEREGMEAVVRVTDTGIGIEPSMLPFIFDPFMQVDSGSLQSQKGLGIGLALLRRLVEMHGGTATASSAGLGHGSEFVVRLPLLRSEASSSHPANSKPAHRDDPGELPATSPERDPSKVGAGNPR